MKAMAIQVITVEATDEEVAALRAEQSDMAKEIRRKGEETARGDQRLVGADIVVLVDEEIDDVALRYLAVLGIDTGEIT